MPETITVVCPKCRTRASVSAVQGDRCPGCHMELTWFRPNEHQVALDFHGAVTGEKYLVEVPGKGWISAHA